MSKPLQLLTDLENSTVIITTTTEDKFSGTVQGFIGDFFKVKLNNTEIFLINVNNIESIKVFND